MKTPEFIACMILIAILSASLIGCASEPKIKTVTVTKTVNVPVQTLPELPQELEQSYLGQLPKAKSSGEVCFSDEHLLNLQGLILHLIRQNQGLKGVFE